MRAATRSSSTVSSIRRSIAARRCFTAPMPTSSPAMPNIPTARMARRRPRRWKRHGRRSPAPPAPCSRPRGFPPSRSRCSRQRRRGITSSSAIPSISRHAVSANGSCGASASKRLSTIPGSARKLRRSSGPTPASSFSKHRARRPSKFRTCRRSSPSPPPRDFAPSSTTPGRRRCSSSRTLRHRSRRRGRHQISLRPR